MKTLFASFIVALTLAAAAVLSTVPLTAQDKPLNMAEVQRLIASGQPADHARLAAHFGALADRYAADAKRHATMQPAFAGNPKLAYLAPTQAAHCRQLATRNEASAATLRELAAHHSKEAAGTPSEPPRGSERFQGEAPIPSDAELIKLAASAETAADHRALERYFTVIAERYDRDAKESVTYARSWRGLTKNPSAPALATRWEGLAKQQQESAAEARAAAKLHHDAPPTTK